MLKTRTPDHGFNYQSIKIYVNTVSGFDRYLIQA